MVLVRQPRFPGCLVSCMVKARLKDHSPRLPSFCRKYSMELPVAKLRGIKP